MVATRVRLIGKTLHGKNRIRQHGDIWEVVDRPDRPDRLALQSLNKTFGGFSDGHKEKDWRWVFPKNDPDFEVIEID